MTNVATINILVKELIGTGWNREENMVKGDLYSVNKDNVYEIEEEEDTMDMAADAFDMGRIDQAAVIDQYHWFWDRGLELGMIDAERKTEKAESELQSLYWAKSRLSYIDNQMKALAKKGKAQSKIVDKALKVKPADVQHYEDSYEYEASEYTYLRMKYKQCLTDKARAKSILAELVGDETLEVAIESAKEELRANKYSYNRREETEELVEEEKYNSLHWKHVFDKGDSIYNKMMVRRQYGKLNNELTMRRWLKRIGEMKNRKELTTYHYAMIAHQLYDWLDFPNKSAEMYRLWKSKEAAVNKKYQPKDITVSYEDPMHGETGVSDMAGACDSMAFYRREARRTNTPLKEAAYKCMVDREEAQFEEKWAELLVAYAVGYTDHE